MPKQTSRRDLGDHAAPLRALTRSKLHLAPGTLARIGTGPAESLGSSWAPIEALREQLRRLSVGLLWYWADQDRGHVLIGPADRGYVPGLQRSGRRQLDCVAFLSAADLATPSRRPLVLVAHLLDHLLGCGGLVDGRWLSDGGGSNHQLRDVGMRVRELFGLGYGRSEETQRDAHAYFAAALVDFCFDRKALNAADPRMERLLRQTLMSEDFWRALAEDG